MALLVPDAGEVKMLQLALAGNTTLKLFISNTTPAEGDTAASYTEMSTLGYAAKTLTGGSWSVSSAAGVTTASYAEQTYTFTGGTPVTVYGYFIIEATGGVILWAERFTASQVIQNTGDQIKITPKITLE